MSHVSRPLPTAAANWSLPLSSSLAAKTLILAAFEMRFLSLLVTFLHDCYEWIFCWAIYSLSREAGGHGIRVWKRSNAHTRGEQLIFFISLLHAYLVFR